MSVSRNISTLKERWMVHTDTLCSDSDLRLTLFDEIEQAYGNADRHYHGLSHLTEIFRQLDAHSSEISATERLNFAAWYHDIVYDTKSTENEENSANLARRALDKLGAAQPLADEVAGLILATKAHGKGGLDTDDNLFLDIDFSILGVAPDIYDTYTQNVRREYAWLSDTDFTGGRLAFLQNALKQETLFLTDKYETAFGDQARRNIRRELEQLQILGKN